MLQWLLLIHTAFAAPMPQYPKHVKTTELKELLASNPEAERIKKMGPKAYEQLTELMFSSNENMNVRWNATLSLAKIGGQESVPELEKALKNDTWFMRSAGLLGLSLVTKNHGEKEAKKLLQEDPALLVRATALQVLAQNNKMDRQFLWGELYNPLNFKGGISLSLRLSLLKVLGKEPQLSDTPKYIALLREDDSEIRQHASVALQDISKIKTTGKQAQSAEFWKSWWNDNKTVVTSN